jgi:hypothetical protein
MAYLSSYDAEPGSEYFEVLILLQERVSVGWSI